MTGPALTADSLEGGETAGAEPNTAARAAVSALLDESPETLPSATPAPASAPTGRPRGRPPTRHKGKPQPAAAAPRPPAPAVSKPAPIPPEQISEAQSAVTDALVEIFALISLAKGPGWKITKERATPAGYHLGKWLAPYLPKMGEWVPLGLGALALGGIIRECAAKESELKSKPAAADPSTPALLELESAEGSKRAEAD